ncbi:hypothetical protein ACFQZX_08955 [Mucilaginibacter litoreus]|uniref:DUF4296 domain-containing protein n=1 Tax=Mucilaginibacter litoreus TaxID=1048221 RepID=A0ABW3ASC1_9SPHI
MTLKQSFTILALCILSQSCQNTTNKNGNAKIAKPDSSKKYILTILQDSYNESANKFKPDNLTDTISAANDTVAYLNALKRFYDKKIVERKNMNYGQPKSFTITDLNGLDLKGVLPPAVIATLKEQVTSIPDVKNMIEEYRKDSL